MSPTVIDILRSALGLACWQVRWDVQIGLDLTFGEPRLTLGKPHAVPNADPGGLIRTRGAYLSGSHWLACAHDSWAIHFPDGSRTNPQSSSRRKDRSVAWLSGQRLDFVGIELATGETTFGFDLGAYVLAKRPRNWRAHPEDGLWTFQTDADEVEVRLRATWTHLPRPGRRSRPKALRNGPHQHLVISTSRVHAI